MYRRNFGENSEICDVTSFACQLTNNKSEHGRTPLYRTLKGTRNWFDIAAVRYIRTFIKADQIKGKRKTIQYSGGSLYRVFDITKFDCITY